MPKWVIQHKGWIFLITVLFLAYFLAHTVFVSKVTTPVFDMLRDSAVLFIGITFAGYNVQQAQRTKKDWGWFVALACLFVMVATLHLLRLIYGGLLC